MHCLQFLFEFGQRKLLVRVGIDQLEEGRQGDVLLLDVVLELILDDT